MTKPTTPKPAAPAKQARRQHTPEFRIETLALAERIGVAAAARQLGIHESQIYGWRNKASAQGTKGEADQQATAEIARLKRLLAERDEEVAILKKASAYFARNQK
jgi:transposase